ncbi:MAG: hypothetical protein AAF719_09990 [Pseudomonadota bacterium]
MMFRRLLVATAARAVATPASPVGASSQKRSNLLSKPNALSRTKAYGAVKAIAAKRSLSAAQLRSKAALKPPNKSASLSGKARATTDRAYMSLKHDEIDQ